MTKPKYYINDYLYDDLKNGKEYHVFTHNELRRVLKDRMFRGFTRVDFPIAQNENTKRYKRKGVK